MHLTSLTPLLLTITLPLFSSTALATNSKPTTTLGLHYNIDDYAPLNQSTKTPPRFQLWSVKLTFPPHLFIPGYKLFAMAQTAYNEMDAEYAKRFPESHPLDRRYEPSVVSVLAMGNVVYVTSDWAELPHHDRLNGTASGEHGNKNDGDDDDETSLHGDRYFLTPLHIPPNCPGDIAQTLLRCQMGLQKIVSQDQTRHVHKATCSELLAWLQYCNDPHPPSQEIAKTKRIASFGRAGRAGEEVAGFLPPCQDYTGFRSTTWGCAEFLKGVGVDGVPALVVGGTMRDVKWEVGREEEGGQEVERGYVPLC